MAKGDLAFSLYERAVQSVASDVCFLERAFARRVGRPPRTLREDFSGTAALSVSWVESDDDREATAVDHDRRALSYARRHHVPSLGEDAERLSLVHGDVRARSDRVFDLICAMNFSWAILDDPALLAYLRNAADCLEDDGLLALEMFGGRELTRVQRQEHPHEGFVHVWDQVAYDEASACLDARIHFRLDDGAALDDAFAYRFHLRSLPRLRALAVEAGLSAPELCLQDSRGRLRSTRGTPRAPLFCAVLLCGRAPPGESAPP